MSTLPWWMWERAAARLRAWVHMVALHRAYAVAYRRGDGSYIDFTRRRIVVDPAISGGKTWTPEARAVPTTWGGLILDRPTQLDVYLARAAAYHEAGHAVFTTPVRLPRLLHFLWNALEDQRMERLTARIYPPVAADFYEMGRRFWLNGYPGGQGRVTDLANACLYHRWDVHRRPDEPSRLVIHDPALRAAWEERLRPVVEAAWQAPTSRHVEESARRILAIIGAPPAAEPPLMVAGGSGQGAAPHGERGPDDEELERSVVVPAPPARPSPPRDDAPDDAGPAEGETAVPSRDTAASDTGHDAGADAGPDDGADADPDDGMADDQTPPGAGDPDDPGEIGEMGGDRASACCGEDEDTREGKPAAAGGDVPASDDDDEPVGGAAPVGKHAPGGDGDRSQDSDAEAADDGAMPIIGDESTGGGDATGDTMPETLRPDAPDDDATETEAGPGAAPGAASDLEGTGGSPTSTPDAMGGGATGEVAEADTADGGRPGAGWEALADAEDEALVTDAPDVDPSGGVGWMQPWGDLAREVLPFVRGLVAQLRVETPDTAPVMARRGSAISMRAYARTRGARPFLRYSLPADSPRALAVLIAIDGTASMGGHPGGISGDNRPLYPALFDDPAARMPHVRRAAFGLHLACGELGIPLAIAECCTLWRRIHAPHLPSRVRNTVTWLQRWDTPPTAEGPKALIAGLYGHAGDGEAVVRSLRLMAPELAARPEPTRVLIYIHDGRPTDDPIPAIQDQLRHVRQTGIIVLGLYLGEPSSLPTMEEIFGRPFTIGVEHTAALPAQLGALLKRYRLGT